MRTGGRLIGGIWRDLGEGFLERRWELREDFLDMAVFHPHVFADIGGVLTADELTLIRDIQGLLKPWEACTSVMQSDKPQFWSASAYLPNLLTLQVAMRDDTLVSVLGSGEDRKVKQKLTHAELHPAAQRLRIKCRDEIEKNYRHTKEGV